MKKSMNNCFQKDDNSRYYKKWNNPYGIFSAEPKAYKSTGCHNSPFHGKFFTILISQIKAKLSTENKKNLSRCDAVSVNSLNNFRAGKKDKSSIENKSLVEWLSKIGSMKVHRKSVHMK